MSSVEIGGNYMSRGTILADGSETECYTVPAKKWASLTSIRAAKNDGAAGTARVVWFIAQTGTAVCLAHDAVIPANSALEIELKPLAMRSGDEIRVTASAGVHVVISGLEEARSGT
ncbi:hypothetical protein [Kaistia terrae]|uniref:DUF126 domain-containing protein n=1 Tax=Kaistia terrae TaxID=537017 RepID=A0ABW0Q3Z8_9HYPH|nr:hypothetical protein [Kaistia terrae]MCX5581491.1 hypothetical protein [Kaistia terrae]